MLLDDPPCSGGYSLWKPPSSYFPQGEAPPPYEEAIASTRADQALLSLSPQNVSPSNISRNCLTVNNPTNLSLVKNSQNGLPASSPVLSQINATSSSPNVISINKRPLSSPAAHSYYEFNPSEVMNLSYCTGACSTSLALNPILCENLSNSTNRSGRI